MLYLTFYMKKEITMKQKTFFILVVLWLCLAGTVQAQGPVKPKLCSTCGKMVVNCPYKGNHPKCATCGKLKEKCAYKGNHPVCSTCGKLKENCTYGGNHPVCSTCGKLKENCSYNGDHPKCPVCGNTRDECPFRGIHFRIDDLGDRLIITINQETLQMIKVEGGTFWMGAQKTKPSSRNYISYADDSEGPVHEETVSTFYMGETEVTQELWQAVMGSNPSAFTGSQLPVEQVYWDDCQSFIAKLNEQTGRKFRLPTEAEWEYAARGGNQSKGYKYAGSDNIDEVAWYKMNSSETTHPVKQKAPNELGLYDMCGNVWEWTSSYWSSRYYSTENRSFRVGRGGSWHNHRGWTRVSYRFNFPDKRDSYIGFRLTLDPQ